MPPSALFVWMLALVTTMPVSDAAGVSSRDDPRACPWDVKICGDGTWVYRVPERNCAFGSCWVRIKEQVVEDPTESDPDDDKDKEPATLPPETTTDEDL